VQAFTKYIKIK